MTIGLGRLNTRDGRREVGDVERKMFDADVLAAVQARVMLDPLRVRAAINIVRCQNVATFAMLLHDLGHQGLDLLRRCHRGANMPAVANAALIERVAKEETLELAGHRTHHFAR